MWNSNGLILNAVPSTRGEGNIYDFRPVSRHIPITIEDRNIITMKP